MKAPETAYHENEKCKCKDFFKAFIFAIIVAIYYWPAGIVGLIFAIPAYQSAAEPQILSLFAIIISSACLFSSVIYILIILFDGMITMICR
jgi:hypothetical protein